MELRKGNGIWNGWWEVIKPEKRIVEYLRRDVPQAYRQFDGELKRWYVHDKHAESVKQMMYSHGVVEDDPWAVLHLRPGAPKAIIQAAWRALAKELHPDHGGDEKQFMKVKAAYDKLMKV